MEQRRYRVEFLLESFLRSDKELCSRDKTVRLIPNPESNNLLDKAIIEIESGSMEEAMDKAYDILSHYLSTLSYEYDCPMLISGPPSCHETGPNIGGKITGSISHSISAYIAGSARIDRLPDIAEYESMEIALACYREARSCTNEFHQYLNYYKVIENLLKVKGNPYKKLKQVGVTVDSKLITQDLAEEIYEDRRCALAHASRKPTLIRDSIDDLRAVRKGLPVIEDIARQCLEFKKRSLEDNARRGSG